MNPEDALHIAIADYLRARERDCVWWHTANQRRTSPRQGAKLKRMGVVAGVPDLAFVLPGGRAAYIEIKLPKSTATAKTYLRPSQRRFRDRVAALGA
ncbi:MAG: hypothetical protein ACE5EM_12430 [Sphingomonadales bacterium]